MKLWKNAELRVQAVVYVLFTAIGTGVALWAAPQAWLLFFVLFLAMAWYHFYVARRRYGALGRLSAEIDAILHGAEQHILSDYREGELSLLRNEVMKLVVRLREQNDRMREDKEHMADLIADISHQLRTPLTALHLTVASMGSEEGNEEQKEHLRELRSLMLRIDWLVEALLKIARLDAGIIRFQKQEVPLAELLKKAAEPFEIPMELREQRLVLEAAGSFSGDLSWTAEAVGNIMKNCLEHMPDGGTLWITARENAIYAEIVIRDEGEGIAKEDLPHLFERFYKGKNSSRQSIGIGLALSRMIVTGQNGTIKADNHPAGGAVFTLRFYKGIV